jgi:hypothetical protein
MTVYIPSFGVKDPNDKRPKNFDAAAVIAAAGNPTVTSWTVFVDDTLGSADGELVISDVVWDPVSKRISFWWSGGTVGQVYVVTARIGGSNGFSVDQSASVTIGHK